MFTNTLQKWRRNAQNTLAIQYSLILMDFFSSFRFPSSFPHSVSPSPSLSLSLSLYLALVSLYTGWFAWSIFAVHVLPLHRPPKLALSKRQHLSLKALIFFFFRLTPTTWISSENVFAIYSPIQIMELTTNNEQKKNKLLWRETRQNHEKKTKEKERRRRWKWHSIDVINGDIRVKCKMATQIVLVIIFFDIFFFSSSCRCGCCFISLIGFCCHGKYLDLYELSTMVRFYNSLVRLLCWRPTTRTPINKQMNSILIWNLSYIMEIWSLFI